MAVTLKKGQLLTKDDLNIYILDADTNQYFSPFFISYSIYKININAEKCCEEAIYETLESIPVPFGIGKFFAPWKMPFDIEIGSYRIKWNIKKFYDSSIFEECEEFEIITPVSKYRQACCLESKSGSSGYSNLPHNSLQGGCPEAT